VSFFIKKTIAFFLLIAFITACGPNRYYQQQQDSCLTSINIVDRNGLTETINNQERLELYKNVNFLQPQPYQKVLRIYSRDNQGNIPARITSYHQNGYPNKYLEVINSRACGIYKEWYANGNQKIEAFVIEGTADVVDGSERTWVFDGLSQAWNDCGQLEASIFYVKGNLEGVATYYHSNGCVWKSIPYFNNLVEGTLEIFCDDGTLLQTINYRCGVKEGNSIRYWDEEKIAAEEVYSEGLLCSGKYYNNCGTIIAAVDAGKGVRAIFGKDSVVEFQEYQNGILEGEVRVLDRFGRVNNLYHTKNGSKHGEEICYYDAPRFKEKLQPKLSLNWYDGKIQGIVKTWYDNGVLESQREMSNNSKNGHSSAWYYDASLMLIEEYEQDKLIKGEYYSLGEKYPISIVNEGKGTATLFDAQGNFVHKVDYINGKPVLDE